MVKYETHLQGDFDELLDKLHEGILNPGKRGNTTEKSRSDYHSGNVRCAVRVYEDHGSTFHSYTGFTIMLLKNENELFLSALSLDGNFGGIIHKRFLDKTIKVVEEYKQAQGQVE